MLNQYRKCEIVMGTENCTGYGNCPSQAKKSKTSTKHRKNNNIQPKNAQVHRASKYSQWNCLPALVLHEIYDLLSPEDRSSASCVCKHWRQHTFHPKWWQTVTFKIEETNIDKARFFTTAFGKIVTNATIKLNSLSEECIEEFIALLRILSENDNLKEMFIEPSHCRFENVEISGKNEVVDIINLLKPTLSKLSKFSIGCVEALYIALGDILKNLIPTKVTHLGLASVREDLYFYQSLSSFEPDFLITFKELKILSIDYDQLSDKFLNNLEYTNDLERLVVHLHGIRRGHPGTTDDAWQLFRKNHRKCEFRLNVIHAFNDIKSLHLTVLQQKMPLTHLKVFFCESINIDVLENLGLHYRDTIKSVMWVDSSERNCEPVNGTEDRSWIFINLSYDNDYPDPLVLLAWQCSQLEEIVLYGYKYYFDNLIAISRLRGAHLKKLEIAEQDIYDMQQHQYNLTEIPRSMKRQWAPIKSSELHPVITNPTAGDSDEYLLPIVLADLH